MRLLYSLGIGCYALAVRVAALFSEKPRLMVKGWKDTFDRLTVAPVGQAKTVWFHASSLGEFEQARPVLECFRQQHPDYKICVSFFSPSGYEVRKNYAQADFVCYLPMDSRANAARFVRLLRPSVVFFVKYDFWYNYLEQLRLRNVPTYIFSAIFRPNQYFFKSYGKWFRHQLGACFTHIFVQNQESQLLLQNNGIEHVSIAGDTRFDRVNAIAHDTQHFEAIESFLSHYPDNKVLLAGSSWEPDEKLIKQYLTHYGDGLTLILAPHVIAESHLEFIENLFGKANCVRYSQLAGTPTNSHILIIDNFGMLSSLYRYAHVAYIGGGFGHGIHNTLEAITFGKPVVFGPNYHKFQEAHDIIAMGGGFTHDDYTQLQQHLDLLFHDNVAYEKASAACSQYLTSNLGSTDLILTKVGPELDSK